MQITFLISFCALVFICFCVDNLFRYVEVPTADALLLLICDVTESINKSKTVAKAEGEGSVITSHKIGLKENKICLTYVLKSNISAMRSKHTLDGGS